MVYIARVFLYFGSPAEEGGLMRKLMMMLTAASLVLGVMALQAGAQDGAAGIHALKNATPIVKLAACNGYTGHCGCAPGWVSRCADRCCKCVRCW